MHCKTAFTTSSAQRIMSILSEIDVYGDDDGTAIKDRFRITNEFVSVKY